MAKQTLLGVNYNMVTRQGTGSYETRLYAGTTPLTKRVPLVRCYGTNDPIGTAFGASSQSKAIFDSGYIPWYACDNPGSWASTANGANDTAYTALFRRMCAMDFGGTVDGTVSGAGFGGTKPTYVIFTPHHEADLNPTQGTNSDYRAHFSHVRGLLDAVLASSTYNPGGQKRVLLATCPTGTGTHFGASGWQPTNASDVDVCGYDKYFPSVGPHLDPNAAPPYVDGTGGAVFGGHDLEWLRAECDSHYGADMPMALGEIGVSISDTTTAGGKGLDPNRLTTSSLRYRWFMDADHGMIDYFKNTRLPNGDPKWLAVSYFVIGFGNNPKPPTELAQGYESGIPWKAFKAAQEALVSTTGSIGNPTSITNTPSSSSVVLSWTNASGATGVKIFNGSTLLATAASGATTKTVTGLTAGVAYTLTLKSVAADGSLSSGATTSFTTTTTTDNLPPTVPASVRASGTPTATSFAVAWNASTDQAPVGVTPSGLGGYRAYLNGSSTKYGNDIPAGQLTLGFTGLTPASTPTTYAVRISAFDVAGNESAKSTAVSVVTPAVTDNPPSTPSNVQPLTGLTTIGAYGATWTPSSDDVEVAGYQVSIDGGSPVSVGSAVTWRGTGAAGATHGFRVRAVDNIGQFSPYSASITLTGYAGSGPTPRLTLSPDPAKGSAPLQVTADLSASTDPDGQALTYTYKWGDVGEVGDLTNVTAAQASHTYIGAGAYSAEFGVRDTTNLYASTKQTITAVEGSGGTPVFGFPYVVRGDDELASKFNLLLDMLEGAILQQTGAGWDAEAILRSGSIPRTATNLLPPGIELPRDMTLTTLSYTVGTSGVGTGGTVCICRYVSPSGAVTEIPGSRVTIASGQTQGAVGGLGFDVQAGGNLLFDLGGGSATPAADLRVHVFGV